MRLWRISSHPGLSGVGGTFVSGRWHTMPRHVLYLAEHPALALLEVMAHLELTAESIPLTLRLFSIDLAPRAKNADALDLPAGWQANQPATQALGNRWLDNAATLLLPVPSALIAHATNTLINPRHPQASTHLTETDHGPVWIDPRFIR